MTPHPIDGTVLETDSGGVGSGAAAIIQRGRLLGVPSNSCLKRPASPTLTRKEDEMSSQTLIIIFAVLWTIIGIAWELKYYG